MDEWFMGLIVAAIVGVLGLVGWGAWTDSQSPTIELIKEDWQCTDKKTTILMVPMLVGKVTVMRPQPVTKCIRYERRP